MRADASLSSSGLDEAEPGLRIGSPLLGFTLFPIYVALLLWGGLYLREPRLRALLPFVAKR